MKVLAANLTLPKIIVVMITFSKSCSFEIHILKQNFLRQFYWENKKYARSHLKSYVKNVFFFFFVFLVC